MVIDVHIDRVAKNVVLFKLGTEKVLMTTSLTLDEFNFLQDKVGEHDFRSS